MSSRTRLSASLRIAIVVLGTGLLCISHSAHGQAESAPSQDVLDTLSATIDNTLDTETFAGASWGVQVVNLQSGATLYARNANSNFVPASNVKLFTSAAALEQLGPDYRYRTTVYADGPVDDGTLQGNLIIRGTGDPTIGGWRQRSDPTQVFRQWADSLRARGIEHISGNLIGDDRRIDDTPLGHGWSWDDASYAYSAQIGAFVFNGNTVDLTVEGREAGQPADLSWKPFNTDYVTVVNRSRTIPPDEDDDEEYQRLVGTNTIHVQTRVHPHEDESESITVTNPTRYFTHVLREVLIREGISVDGHAADLDATGTPIQYDDDTVQRVASYTSQPLSAIVQTTNHESQNLYAEQLLRTLAVEAPPDTDEELDPGSSPLGIKAVRKTLANAEVDTSRVQLVDGSGLSRQNFVRPAAMVALLQHMWLHPDPDVSSAFYDALPTGGKDGTLKYRFRGAAPARANVHAKTGTLSNTSSLSGYVNSKTGTPLAFAIFCNHHLADGDQVRAAQDVLVNALAQLSL